MVQRGNKEGRFGSKSNTGIGADEKEQKLSPDLRYRLDWFQGKFDRKFLLKVFRCVTLFLGGGEFLQRTKRVQHFNLSYEHPTGAIIACGRKKPSGVVDESLCYLWLSSSVLLPFKQRRLYKLMRVLRHECEFHTTRLDLCIDDFNKTLDIYKIKRAVDKFHYISFNDAVEFQKYGRKGSRGLSISFGRRGSSGGGKYVIVYDKSKESKGKIDSIRVEASFCGRYAEQLSDNLCDIPYHMWGEIIKEWISGAIDFRRRSYDDDNEPHCRPRLPWWQKIVGDTAKLRPSCEYSVDS